MRKVVLSVCVLLIAMALSGCASQSSVQNSTNSFNYGGQAAGKDETETYKWKNTMGGAAVSWGGQVGKGSLSVTITDNSGKEVFSESLSGAGQGGFSGSTESGTPGTWTIKIAFDDYTGQMGLSIQAQTGGAGGVSW